MTVSPLSVPFHEPDPRTDADLAWWASDPEDERRPTRVEAEKLAREVWQGER